VFSVGILLYQLVTGTLPFSGKNPHETLRLIADCEFRDPQEVNPRVGKRLARIIKKAMSREKSGRYANIGEMRRALESYLEDSGLDEARVELSRYFEAPISYEMALEKRLISALTKRGRKLAADNQLAALEAFNRVLTLDPKNATVLAELDRLSRQRRAFHMLLALVGVVAIAALAYGARIVLDSPASAKPVVVPDAPPVLAPVPDAAPVVAKVTEDAGVAGAFDAGKVATVRPPRNGNNNRRPPPRRRPDAGMAVAKTRTVRLTAFPPRQTQVQVGGGAFVALSSGGMSVQIPEGPTRVTFRNKCCQDKTVTVRPGLNKAHAVLAFLPVQVIPVCGVDGARVNINGRPGKMSKANDIPMGEGLTAKKVTVEFLAKVEQDDGKKVPKRDSQGKSLIAGEKWRVSCRF
jgi:serine/threonine-protein kinase